jgi:hypothetical protein
VDSEKTVRAGSQRTVRADSQSRQSGQTVRADSQSRQSAADSQQQTVSSRQPEQTVRADSQSRQSAAHSQQHTVSRLFFLEFFLTSPDLQPKGALPDMRRSARVRLARLSYSSQHLSAAYLRIYPATTHIKSRSIWPPTSADFPNSLILLFGK